MSNSKKLLFSAVLSLLGLLFPAELRAQFIGYTSPQTVGQVLATNVACTGSVQTFPVNNLGQTQHQATATVSAANNSFTFQFFGVDAAGNATAMSDIATVINAPQNSNGIIGATGYFPIVQIRVNCTGGTFSLNYSGASSTPIFSTGGYSIAALDKVLANNADATTGHLYLVNVSPSLSTSGILIFTYGVHTMANSTVTVQCGSTQYTTYLSGPVFSIGNLASTQVFQVPVLNCPYIQVSYTAGTVVAGTTFNLEYLFNIPGQTSSADPCQNPGVPKSSSPLTAAAAATTQIIAAVTGQSIYVCGTQLSQAATAGTLQWEYGTGASCGTGTTSLSGAMTVTANQPITYSGPGTVMKAPAGNALCLVTTGAGGTAAGIVTFVQQ